MPIPDLSELKRLRQAAGLTQTSLARASGVPQSVISKIEKGKTDPSYSHVRSLFDYFSSAQKTKEKTAADLMSTAVISLKPSDPVSLAVSLMKKHAISALPILSDGRAIGHVSEDTILAHLAEGRQVSGWSVSRIMDEPLARISPSTPAEVVRAMLTHARAVLVTRGEKTAGIITKADLLKLMR